MKNNFKLAKIMSIVLTAAMILSVFTISIPVFAAEKVVKAEEGALYLSDIEWKYWYMYGPCSSEDENPRYTPSKDQNEKGEPISIAHVTYEKGLRSHPDGSDGLAIFTYDISEYSGQYKYFGAVAGKDSEGGGTDIIFEVYLDGELIEESGQQYMGTSYNFCVELNGAKELKLVTNMGENLSSDSFAWGDARLTNVEPPHPVVEEEKEYVYTDDESVTLEVPEGAVYVSDLTWKSWIMYKSISTDPASPYAPSIDKDDGDMDLIIGGDTFAHGLRTHVDTKYTNYAEFVYDISEYKGKVNKFQSVIGKTSNGGTVGAVDYVILVDDGSGTEYVPLEGDDHLVEVGRSHPVEAGLSKMIYANIEGASTLVLRIYDGGDGISNDSAGFGNPVIYAGSKDYVKLEKKVYSSEEVLQVIIDLPANYEPNEKDWIGIYKATADESAISQSDSLGIWCYIGSATKQYGAAESRHIEIEIDNSLAEATTWSDNKVYWPLDPGEYKVMLFYNDSYIVEDSFTFTVEKEPDPTPTPDATEAPADPTDEPAEPTSEPVEKKGCKSSLISSAAVAVITLAGAVVLAKKKEE